MPERGAVVADATPLITLAAATGELEAFRVLYDHVIVLWEVEREVLAAGGQACAVRELAQATWIERRSSTVVLQPFLRNGLDAGEAAVILK